MMAPKISCSRLVGHSFGAAVVISAGRVSPVVTAVAGMSSQTHGAERVSDLSPRPLLLIHGESDEVLPPACSITLYQAANEPKEVILEGEHMSQQKKTCRHEGCTCPIDPDTEYCSPSCATAASGSMRDTCNCGHPGCAKSASNASAEGRPASTITQWY